MSAHCLLNDETSSKCQFAESAFQNMAQERVHGLVATQCGSCVMCCHDKEAGSRVCVWSGLPVFPHD